MCIKRYEGRETSLTAYGPGLLQYNWHTPFVVAPGVDAADALLNLRNLATTAGTFQVKGAYQTAAVRSDAPDAPVDFTAGYATTEGFKHQRQSLAITDKLLVRFGTVHNLSAAGSGRCDVTPTFSLNECGRILAAGRVVVNPGEATTGTDTNTYPVGDWGTTVAFDKVMGGFVVEDNLALNLKYQLVCRTAIDPSKPGPWVVVEAGWTTPAVGNSERNTTALALPAGANAASNFFLQWGIQVTRTGTGNPGAILRLVVAGTVT